MADHELPTYEAVVRHVVDYTSGFTASAQAEKLLLQAHVDSVQINGVSEIKAQGNQNQIDFSFLKKEENEKLLLEVSRLISGEQGQAIMKTVASKINKDISTIKMMFFDLSNRLKEIDDSGKSSTKFAARFSDYQMGFYDAIDRTRTNASAIADYAEIFDDLILPIFEDKTITVDEKKALITDYMNQANAIEEKSQEQKQRFESLLVRFNNFVGDFKNFAVSEEGALDKEIIEAEKQLSELQKELAEAYNNAKLALGSGLAVGAVGAVFLGLLFPPALPAILVGGAAVAGLGASVAAGFAVYAQTIETKISQKKKEIQQKKTELASVKKTREDLVQLGKDDFALMAKSLESLILVWQSAKLDAQSVHTALAQGKNVAQLERGLRIQLDKSVSIYKSVAVYLRGYAKGATGE